MSQVTTHPREIQTFAQVRIVAETQRGPVETVYTATRVEPSQPSTVRGYRLNKHNSADKYHCWLTRDGRLHCTCKDFQVKHKKRLCKHLDALCALGLLDPAEWELICDLGRDAEITASEIIDEAEGKAAEIIAAGEAAARQAFDDAGEQILLSADPTGRWLRVGCKCRLADRVGQVVKVNRKTVTVRCGRQVKRVKRDRLFPV